MKFLSIVLNILYVAAYLFALFFVSKLIAVELIFIPQITSSSLIIIDKMEALILPIRRLRWTNGYNFSL
jgi:hypothetical protein